MKCFIFVLGSLTLAGILSADASTSKSALPSFSVGLDQGSTFRGTNATATDQAFTFAAEYARLGYSVGLVESLATDFDSGQTELFATYSYPLGWVEVSGGIQSFLNFDNGHRDSLELLLEARTEPIYGFNFFLGQYFELTHGFHSYTEFKVSRRFDPTDTFAIEPYALISFGNYHTDTFTFSHAQLGIDSQWTLSEKWSLGLFAAAVIPLNGVQQRTQSSGTEVMAGFRCTWSF